MEQQGLMAEQESLTEDALFYKMADHISDYIHGEARDHIAKAIANSGDGLADHIATLTYQIVTQASEKIAKEDPGMVTIDMLLALAAQTIDFLIEIAHAVGHQVGDEQVLREDSLNRIVQIHMEKVGDDPEQVAIAEQMLAQFAQDGTMDEAAAYFNQRAQERGADPEAMQQQGAQMAAPRQNPMAAGVQQGLLGMSQ